MGDKKESSWGKKTDVEATAIINPKTGNLALSKGEIKKVSLQYTKETLMSNPIEEGVAEERDKRRSPRESFLKRVAALSRSTKRSLRKSWPN